jgi:hypothetical protein
LKYKFGDYTDHRTSLPSGQSYAAGVLRLLQSLNHDPDVLELQWFSAWVVGNHAPADGDSIIEVLKVFPGPLNRSGFQAWVKD